MNGTIVLYVVLIALAIVFAVATILIYRAGLHRKWLDRSNPPD